jgi:hypothetical protein
MPSTALTFREWIQGRRSQTGSSVLDRSTQHGLSRSIGLVSCNVSTDLHKDALIWEDTTANTGPSYET